MRVRRRGGVGLDQDERKMRIGEGGKNNFTSADKRAKTKPPPPLHYRKRGLTPQESKILPRLLLNWTDSSTHVFIYI